MSVDSNDQRSKRAGRKNVVIGSVWEKRIKIDQVKGGVKVYFGGTDEELEEKTDADCSGSDGKMIGRCHLSRKRKKWNQSDCFNKFSVSQPLVQAKSRTPDSARIKNTVPARPSDNRTLLCVEAKGVSKNTSATDGIEEMRRNQVQVTMRTHGSGKNAVPITKKAFRSKDKTEANVDENVKTKMKKKFGPDEISAAEQKLRKLMAENTRRKSREVHSLRSNYKKSLGKSSEFHAAFIKPASRNRKPSTTVLKCDSELILHEVRRYSPVDILTRRDFPISTLVFSVSTVIICARILNISFVSTVSYLGLSYLAVMFTLRPLILRARETMVVPNLDTVISEEEAIEILKVALPYINKFISGLKYLFSGDPALTLKVAVPLFILARCGSCISIWNILVTGFHGSKSLLIIPCLGETLVQRLFIAKKACCKYKITIAMISFVLVWNFCSTIARIWALFMVFVATRCHRQSMGMKR